MGQENCAFFAIIWSLGQLDNDILHELVLACEADNYTHQDTEYNVGFSLCGPKTIFKNRHTGSHASIKYL